MMQAASTNDTSREFPTIAAFEALDIDSARFDHEAHIFMARAYLRELDLLHAIDRYRSTLRQLTVKLGVPDKYHETITWFYMISVALRIHESPDADWIEFRRANEDLFEQNGAFLKAHYSAELLNSERARAGFVLPDQ